MAKLLADSFFCLTDTFDLRFSKMQIIPYPNLAKYYVNVIILES